MTKKRAAIEIIKIRAHIITNWDESEEAYCKAWFGRNWLGHGLVRCGYCQTNAVMFRSYIGEHICEDCEQSLRELEGR